MLRRGTIRIRFAVHSRSLGPFTVNSPLLFDVVMSRGFIEHFDEPSSVVDRHLDLLKPGGLLVVSIPNLRGVNGLLTRFFHNPWFVAIDITFLFIALYHGLNGIRNICLDYTWGARWRTPITIALLVFGILVAYWGVTAFTGNQHLTPRTNTRVHASKVWDRATS